jgi:hypothetical protein
MKLSESPYDRVPKPLLHWVRHKLAKNMLCFVTQNSANRSHVTSMDTDTYQHTQRSKEMLWFPACRSSDCVSSSPSHTSLVHSALISQGSSHVCLTRLSHVLMQLRYVHVDEATKCQGNFGNRRRKIDIGAILRRMPLVHTYQHTLMQQTSINYFLTAHSSDTASCACMLLTWHVFVLDAQGASSCRLVPGARHLAEWHGGCWHRQRSRREAECAAR